MDFTIILVLVGFNALFALSEMAIVASRSARLQHLEDEERPGAAAAAELRREPSRFLSTVQVGITAIGVLSGAVGDAVLAEPLADRLAQVPLLAAHAGGIAFTVTVVLITYLSVVLGELVPKRLALLAPERVALVVAAPMRMLEKLATPFVWLLSKSSDAVLTLVVLAGAQVAPARPAALPAGRRPLGARAPGPLTLAQHCGLDQKLTRRPSFNERPGNGERSRTVGMVDAL
jgi:putative hemolysin